MNSVKAGFEPETEEEREGDGERQQRQDVSEEVDRDGVVLGRLRYRRNLDGPAVVVVRAGVPLASSGTASRGVA